jgi:signal transduction histidine kinase
MALAGAVQALRRIRPLTAFAMSFALMGAVALFFGHYESGGSLLIGLVATYSAVAFGSNLPFVVATLLAFAAVLNLPGQSLDQALADLAFTLPVLLLAGGAGKAVRSVRARAEASAAREVALEAERTRAAEEAAGAERQRIHREMHDILSHSLAVIVLQSGAAEQALERDPHKACEAIRSARTTAQEALSQLHILLRVIRAERDDWRDPTPDLDRLRHLAKQATAAGSRSS